MSIRPLDMQIVVQKTQEIHPAKQAVVNKQDNELLQAQIQNKANYIKDREKVQNTEKTDLKKIKDDEERQSSGREQGRRDSENQSSQKEAQKNSSDLEPIGIYFDMKV